MLSVSAPYGAVAASVHICRAKHHKCAQVRNNGQASLFAGTRCDYSDLSPMRRRSPDHASATFIRRQRGRLDISRLWSFQLRAIDQPK